MGFHKTVLTLALIVFLIMIIFMAIVIKIVIDQVYILLRFQSVQIIGK